HCRSAEENPRLDWIEGSATLTMLRSRMTMNCATQQTTSSQRERPSASGSLGAAVGTTAGGAPAPTSTSAIVSLHDECWSHEGTVDESSSAGEPDRGRRDDGRVREL